MSHEQWPLTNTRPHSTQSTVNFFKINASSSLRDNKNTNCRAQHNCIVFVLVSSSPARCIYTVNRARPRHSEAAITTSSHFNQKSTNASRVVASCTNTECEATCKFSDTFNNKRFSESDSEITRGGGGCFDFAPGEHTRNWENTCSHTRKPQDIFANKRATAASSQQQIAHHFEIDTVANTRRRYSASAVPIAFSDLLCGPPQNATHHKRDLRSVRVNR